MIEFQHRDGTVRLEAGETYATTVAQSYHDAPAEELRALAAEVGSGVPWRDAVRRRYGKSNPWLAQIVTDPSRDLFFRQHPPPPGARVLDIGAGWGQLSLSLAGAAEVTALEPTPERLAFIRAAATQEKLAHRIHFIQADFLEIEFTTRFDIAACIGALEWVPRFRPGDPQAVQAGFLKAIRAVLQPGGKLVLGIENRMGLKYMMGANDDHIPYPNIAVFDRKLASAKYRKLTGQPLRSLTHTEAEYRELLEKAGFSRIAFFAALPDYKLPRHIVPLDPPGALDDFFLKGNFVPEQDGLNGRPLDNQDELQSHYSSLARLGIARFFAPSYYIVAS